MAVHVSGAVLASLFYDHANSVGDQIGFLLGQVASHVTDTISDSQIQNSQVETKIHVYGCVPCPVDQKFYDGSYRIIQSRIVELLEDKHKDIVGWYSFRRNSTMRASFKEQSLHTNLADVLCGGHAGHFLFLLCTSSPSKNLATHTFDHTFLRHTERGFQKVPVAIVNLGDTTHAEYQIHGSQTVSQSRGLFSAFVKKHESQFLEASGRVAVDNIHTLSQGLDEQLQVLRRELLSSEKQVSALEKEVNTYRLQIRENERREMIKASKTSSQGRDLIDTRSNAVQLMEEDDNIANSKKLPSVDDLLSMDCTDADISREKLPKIPVASTSKQNTAEVHVDKMQQNTDKVLPNIGHARKSSNERIKLTPAAALGKMSTNASSIDNKLQLGSSSRKRSESDTSNKKSGDHFDFVSSLLEEAKDSKKSESVDSMSVPVGAEVKLPRASKSEGEEEMDIEQDIAVNIQEEDRTSNKRQRAHKQSVAVAAAAAAMSGSTNSEKGKGQRLRTNRQGQGQSQAQRSKSQENVEQNENSMNSDIFNLKEKSGRVTRSNKTINSKSEHETYIIGDKITKKMESNDSKKSENGDNEDMTLSSSPVF